MTRPTSPPLRRPAGGGNGAGERRAATFFVDAYREFVRLPSARVAYAASSRLPAPAAAGPLPLHDGQGPHGWAAPPSSCCSVPAERVMDDYLLSNRFILGLQPWSTVVARGGDPDLLRPW